MVKHTKLFLWLMLGGICAHLSCNVLNFPKPPATGSTANTSTIINQQSDTVTIETFIIRLASHQNELLQQLWREVDEQSLSPQLRRELLAQGFRVGLLGNLISPALAKFLHVSSEGSTDSPVGNFQEFSATDIIREATATRNVRTLLPEMRAVVKVFDDQSTLPALHLFRTRNGMLEGQTYTDALGLLLVGAAVNKDGSAQIQIIPELEYGTPTRQIRTIAAMVVQQEGKPRHSFEELTISQRLLPGQWIILGTTTVDSAGAGKAFFARTTSAMEQRLLAIRLVRVNPATPAVPAFHPTSQPRGTELGMPERH
jgi:hypothetical protein